MGKRSCNRQNFCWAEISRSDTKKGAEIKKTNYRLAEQDEESKGIDGYIGEIPVSIKPHPYEIKSELPEHIGIKIIYYKKEKDGIEVNYGGIF